MPNEKTRYRCGNCGGYYTISSPLEAINHVCPNCKKETINSEVVSDDASTLILHLKSGAVFEAYYDYDDSFWMRWADNPIGEYAFDNCSVRLENIEFIEFKE